MESTCGWAELHGGARRTSLLAWALGMAALAVVVVAARRSFPAAQTLPLLKRANAPWLALAVLLQASTYLSQGEVWRSVGAAAGFRVPMARAYALSFSKLFIDQTIPSAGLSGTVFAAKALERRGLPRPAGAACVAVNLVSYYFAYALALASAALEAASRGGRGVHFLSASGAFALLGVAVGAGFLLLSRRAKAGRPAPEAWPGRLAGYVRQADPRLLRSPSLLARSAILQLAVILADAATLWALLRALGAHASPIVVFACFMLSSLFRSVAFSPGGLGAFEGSCVLALARAGVAVPAALSATLLFRVLSFWLPMLPGAWSSRTEVAP